MDFTKVTNYLDSLKDVGIPGADLAIYIKGKEVYRHYTGFANIETQKTIDAKTIYPIWSMTKIVTCVAALQFYEKGVFLLKDNISDYLPEFKNMEVRHVLENGEVHVKPATNPIKIVDLFTMSSGMSYDFSEHLVKLYEKTKGNYTLKEFSEAISKDPLHFEPGTHWHYSFSHDILGRLVEVLSGKTLGEYFYENIFAPLGMNDTFFRIPEDKEERKVSCYEYDENKKSHSLTKSTLLRHDRGYKFESPGGGLLSTVDDYAKFANALCLELSDCCTENHKLLSKATLELMRTNHLDDVRYKEYNNWLHTRGYGYGLGVRTLVDRAAGGSNSYVGEFGWAGMMGNYVVMDPAIDLTYVYAQQLFPSKEGYVAPRLRNVIYGCL